jgi:hypothetical protein
LATADFQSQATTPPIARIRMNFAIDAHLPVGQRG